MKDAESIIAACLSIPAREEEESSAPHLEGAGRLRGAGGAAPERGPGARDKVRDHVPVSLAEASRRARPLPVDICKTSREGIFPFSESGL